jgi:hypothetical protein
MIGYQASHEQFTPSDLLDFAHVADEAGFTERCINNLSFSAFTMGHGR